MLQLTFPWTSQTHNSERQLKDENTHAFAAKLSPFLWGKQRNYCTLRLNVYCLFNSQYLHAAAWRRNIVKKIKLELWFNLSPQTKENVAFGVEQSQKTQKKKIKLEEQPLWHCPITSAFRSLDRCHPSLQHGQHSSCINFFALQILISWLR